MCYFKEINIFRRKKAFVHYLMQYRCRAVSIL
jgi:hypothetical protein